MTTFARTSLVVLALALAACGGGGSGGTPTADGIVLPFPFSEATFSGHAIDNPFFPLTPGTTLTYGGATAEGDEVVVVEITHATRTILGVVCVVVHARAFLDGDLVEDTLDWYAQDDAGNVWYFGEDSKDVENGVVVGTAGSWEAGVNGAQAGILMLAQPTVGQTYSQEYAAGVAEDMATVVGLGEPVEIDLGTFMGCLHTFDFTPLDETALEAKYYAPGVGVVLEVNAAGERIELLSIAP